MSANVFPIPRETVPCKYCGTATRQTGTQMCNGCWEVEHRLETFAKSKAGRKLMRKVMRCYNPLALWVVWDRDGLEIHTRYCVLAMYPPSAASWDWGSWRPKGQQPRKWCRLRVWLPMACFEIKGTDFWGRQQ